MAKTCKIEQVKRQKLYIARYADRRAKLVAVIKNPDATLEERTIAYKKIARMPRDASKVRLRNRCELTGRPRAYLRKFRLGRNMFRLLALEGKIPGVTKSSW